MKSDAELSAYFEATMRPVLEALEAERKRYRPRIWRYLRWLLAAWVAAVAVAFANGLNADQIYEELLPVHAAAFFGVFLVAGWRFVRYALHVQPILERCKAEVIVPMVRWLAPELNYHPNQSVELSLAEHSGLLRPHDRLEGEDYFQGRLGRTELEFCELVVHYHTTERSREGRTQTRHHQERGLFLVASANKPFAGETRILPDLLEGLVGDSAARLLTAAHVPSAGGADSTSAAGATRLHQIHLENPAFEKWFRVYCSDDVEAHYLLTPSLMERLIGYREKAGREARMCFKDAKLFAYFPPEPGKAFALFDVGGFQELDAFEPYRAIRDELVMALGIVEELNLNLRIWGPTPPGSV